MPFLKKKNSDETLAAIIERLIEEDFARLKKADQFEFNWDLEREHEVYKITLISNEKEILGVMSLIDRADEYRIHLNLIEIQAQHIGKDKKIERIAGCLIAFACELAFARGYNGFVSLQPKTRLIDLYQDKYGFAQYGRLLGVEDEGSIHLIQKYLSDEVK